MLDAHDAVVLLVERGLVDPAELVDGELQLVEASRRNRNLRVLRRRGPSYLLKQGLGPERRRTVAHEAAVHHYLDALGDERLRSLLPRVVDYVAAQRVLLLELVEDGESLESRHARRRSFPPAHAARLARAVAAVHAATATERAQRSYARRFPGALPWSLRTLHRPTAAMTAEISNGNALAIRMIQSSSGFPELLEAVAGDWRPRCLVHGDLRFDNCVLGPAPDAHPEHRLTIVDWELALWGDPCWDVGAVLAGYLVAWLLGCPISGETPPEAVLHLGLYRLGDMQRAAGAFWAAYEAALARAPGPGVPSLPRAMQFAGVRVLQYMVEELQPSAELTGRAVCLAQLARNLLESPEDAAAHFVGARAA